MMDTTANKAEIAQALMDRGISLVDPAPGLARLVLNDRHFRAFILATPSAKRLAAYNALLPHLTFKPSPYFLLVSTRKGKKHRVKVPVTLDAVEVAATVLDNTSDAKYSLVKVVNPADAVKVQ